MTNSNIEGMNGEAVFLRKASATPGLLTNTGLTLSSMEYNVFFWGWLTLGPNQSFMVLPIKPLLVSPRVIMALPLSGSQLTGPRNTLKQPLALGSSATSVRK